MSTYPVYNVNIVSDTVLPTPREIMDQLPLTEELQERIVRYRIELQRILNGEDSRLFVVVGPCSIHDTRSALEYAGRLSELAAKVSDTMLLVMRVYFEKPRTVSGWKGFINDPDLDDSFHIQDGLFRARQLLLQLAELGLPVGTEALDPITPQYIGDLIGWTAIGARTTESQTHREMTSGLSTPVAFKNGTDGNIEVAINAVRSAALPHRFLGINADGQCSVFPTRGNRYGHVVLRGGVRPNYDAESIAACEARLEKAGLRPNIVVDCSHGNSSKDPSRQPLVFRSCIDQVLEGNSSIVGLMLEGHLFAGRQDVPADPKELRYGVSITDGCIDWETTEQLILDAHERLASGSTDGA
ncbi:MAG: 3-deoxy-D-arabinoheptulosonate-7-phosphate synthase [Armatimonadetes bacterium]|nr:3-deoxy-D-arabinoheptulosonate-7-phosphate synthase [Armatimonadota bacterium]